MKTKTPTHTPTPWRIQDTGENHPMYLIGQDGTLLADIYWRLDGLKNFQAIDDAKEDAAHKVLSQAEARP